MTKLGWTILAIIVLAVAGFVSMLSIGGGEVASVARQQIRPLQRPVQGPLVVPVRGVQPAALTDSWGDAREGGARTHHGTDIMAARGTPVVAAAAGTVEKLHRSAAGGLTIYIRSPDRRLSFYYAHLAGYAPGMVEGRAVVPGELIGYVGDTGNAGTGNYHLHFGMSRMRGTDRWWQGEPFDPFPVLARAKAAR